MHSCTPPSCWTLRSICKDDNKTYVWLNKKRIIMMRKYPLIKLTRRKSSVKKWWAKLSASNEGLHHSCFMTILAGKTFTDNFNLHDRDVIQKESGHSVSSWALSHIFELQAFSSVALFNLTDVETKNDFICWFGSNWISTSFSCQFSNAKSTGIIVETLEETIWIPWILFFKKGSYIQNVWPMYCSPANLKTLFVSAGLRHRR